MPIDQERTHKLFRRAGRLIRRAGAHPTPEAVHQLRTTVRRLETVFEQLAILPGRNQKKVLKRLMRLRRRAGRIRDLDVQMAALRTLKIGSDGQRKEALLRDLARERSRREKRLIRALDRDATEELLRRLPRAAEQLPLFPPDASPDFDPVRVALNEFAGLARDYAELDAANLHDFRKQCKRVRYLAEMAGDDARTRAVVGRLKAAQDAIGAWHDWQVLAQRAEKLFTGESPLTSALKNVRNARFHDALRVAAGIKRDLLTMRRAGSATRKQPRSEAAGSAAATA